MEPAASPFPPAISVPAPAAPPSTPPPPEPRGSAPPRDALVWRADRVADAEHLWARLLALPLFEDFTPERLRAIARQVTVLRRNAGEALLRAAPFGDAVTDTPLLVVTDGAASLRVGDARLPAQVGVGDTVGEHGALYGGPSVVDAVAEVPVTAVCFAPALARALARECESFRGALEESAWERAFAAVGLGAPLLRRLPEAARAQVFARFEPVALAEGEALLAEDVTPTHLWLVAAGEVEVYGGSLDPLGCFRARAGDALGVEASVGDGPSGVSARALRTALAARVPAAAFRELTRAHPALRGAVEDVGVPGRAVLC
jgi:CRP-like cAMP-binding protein